MSGPMAEVAQLHTRVRFEAFYWPLEVWTDQGEAHIGCVLCCESIMKAQSIEKPTSLADLNAKVEAHMAKCKEVSR